MATTKKPSLHCYEPAPVEKPIEKPATSVKHAPVEKPSYETAPFVRVPPVKKPDEKPAIIKPAPMEKPIDKSISTSTRWMGTAIIAYISVVLQAGKWSVAGVLPMIQFEFGETDQQSGLIQAIHGFLNSTSTLLVAILATKLSRKTLLIFGLITWSAATVASAFMRSYFLFLLLRCLVAFSDGFITTLGPVITSDLFNQPEERTAALTVDPSRKWAGIPPWQRSGKCFRRLEDLNCWSSNSVRHRIDSCRLTNVQTTRAVTKNGKAKRLFLETPVSPERK